MGGQANMWQKILVFNFMAIFGFQKMLVYTFLEGGGRESEKVSLVNL